VDAQSEFDAKFNYIELDEAKMLESLRELEAANKVSM